MRRWRGRARAPKRAVRRSRCERFSSCRPPKRTEPYGCSELVLRSGLFETRLPTDVSKEATLVCGRERRPADELWAGSLTRREESNSLHNPFYINPQKREAWRRGGVILKCSYANCVATRPR